MNYYESEMKRLKELIIDSISIMEESKSLMEDGKFINAYKLIDDKLHKKLINMNIKIHSIDGNMRLDNTRSEPIRNVIIDEIVSSDGYDEYSRDYLSDLTDIELVKKFHSLFGSMKLHVLLKESSISNQ